jgi:hypothetical protein
MYVYARYEVATTKRRIERAKSLKQEVLSFTSTALLKQNASFNCNGRYIEKRRRRRRRRRRRKKRLTFFKVASVLNGEDEENDEGRQ